MNEFKFSCPQCGQHIQCGEAYSGRQINCPTCQQLIVVPQSSWAAKSSPPPFPATRQNAAAPVDARTTYRPPLPPVQTGSRAMRNVLIISAVVVACVVLGGGGWYFYSKHKAQVEANGNSSALSRHQRPVNPQAAAAAKSILENVGLAYRNLSNFSATGTSLQIVDLSGLTPEDISLLQGNKKNKKSTTVQKPPTVPQKPQKTTIHFLVKLAKPDLYRIDYSMKTGRTNTFAAAIWSAGDGDFVLMGKRYMKLPDGKAALQMIENSGGMSIALAQLFFEETDGADQMVKDWEKADDDTLNGEDCYTLTGTVNQFKFTGQKLRVWVSKANYLILQSQIMLGGKMSDADIAEEIKSLGTNVPPGQVAQMKARLKQVAAMSSKIKGAITETYDTIETNNTFTADDFKYPVPSNAKLSSSL